MTSFFHFFAKATISSYSAVLFSGNPFVGLFLFLATLFQPIAGISGLIGIFFVNGMALLLGVSRDRIKEGLYGYNGLLVGLSISFYHSWDSRLLFVLLVASLLLIFLILFLESFFHYNLGLPVLSLPFVMVSTIVYIAFYDMHALNLRTTTWKIAEEIPFFLPSFLNSYLRSLAGIFFQTSPVSGFLIALALFFSSRILFFLSWVGYLGGVMYKSLVSDIPETFFSGNLEFNSILSAMAIGGFFLVPNVYTFLLGWIASLLTSLFTSFAKIFFIQFNLPVFALPFTFVTLLMLYGIRQVFNSKFVFPDFKPGSPERNLDYYETRKKRFGNSGLLLRLPFSGIWKVSQGYNGKHTHQNEWKESLDFMAIGEDLSYSKVLNPTKVEDYYSFGLQVFAPAAGKIIKVVDYIEDNALFEVNITDNWGNFVIIEHSPFLFSQISHFQRKSIVVKEGDYVFPGAKLGLVGNSGRSSEPHIHLHFQSTREVGGKTIPIHFTQYRLETEEGLIQFNSIPKEDQIVSNLHPDFNLKNFFQLYPGDSFEVQFTMENEEPKNYKIKIGLDLLGNSFFQDKDGNILFYSLGLESFASLDYFGSKDGPLFYLFLSFYRFPFSSTSSKWRDLVSYKHVSSPIIRFSKDLIHPFTTKVSLDWFGSIDYSKGDVVFQASISNGGKAFQANISFEKKFPGKVQGTDFSGRKWLCERIS